MFATRGLLPSNDGFTPVVATVIALLVGYVLDRWLGTVPWLVLIGLTLAVAANFVAFRRR